VAKYDVAIIGSGPGGYVAAIRAGELGLKAIVVEKDPFLGGTCLHVGCIPTKVLLHHADVYDHFKNGAELGFEVSGLKINWANILARKDKIVKKHAKGIEFLFKKNKVEWVQGWGRYEGSGRVSIEKDGKKTQIEASNILLVSGSEARALPGIEPDHKSILTNRSILELPEIPKTLIVVGAGAVGVEFASIYNSFGTQVTILEALPRVVPVEDEEISVELDKAFRKKNINIFMLAPLAGGRFMVRLAPAQPRLAVPRAGLDVPAVRQGSARLPLRAGVRVARLAMWFACSGRRLERNAALIVRQLGGNRRCGRGASLAR